MKILVFSDSHGKIKHMDSILQGIDADAICFLGDCLADLRLLEYTPKSLHAVPGNCDFMPDIPNELIVELGGKRIWLTHGHYFGVKSGYQHIIYAAKSRKVDICLFGHSHSAASFTKNNILFLNPGSCSSTRDCKGDSYAIIEIAASGDISSEVVRI